MRPRLVLLLLSLPGECGRGSEAGTHEAGQRTKSFPRQKGRCLISGEMRCGFVDLFSKNTLGSYFVPGIHQTLRRETRNRTGH